MQIQSMFTVITCVTLSRTKVISNTMLNASLATLSALEDYFEVGFMLPKLDMIAVPEMLFVGMENHGCCFLHVQSDDDTMDTLAKDILHEIAHHWVGNFVGMSVKMKEGIVQYLEKHLGDKLFAVDSAKKNKKKKQQVHSFTTKDANPGR